MMAFSGCELRRKATGENRSMRAWWLLGGGAQSLAQQVRRHRLVERHAAKNAKLKKLLAAAACWLAGIQLSWAGDRC